MRDAIEDKVEAQKEQWQAKIDELKAKAKEATADARITIQREIDELQSRLHT
jgi:uncharacterized protein YjbJ (UPF0337 family)